MSKIQKSRRITVLLLAILWTGSCSQKVAQQETAASVTNSEATHQEVVVDSQEYQLGIDALAIKDYSTAKKIFNRFARKNPTLSGAYLNLAFIAFRQQEYDEADRLTASVLQLNSDHAQAYHLRALLNQQKGEIRMAEKDYNKAIELNPSYAIAHYNLALLYDIFLQELSLAIQHYSIYLDLLDREDEDTRNWIKHLKNTIANG